MKKSIFHNHNLSSSEDCDLGPDAYDALAPFYDVLELDSAGSTTALNQFLQKLMHQHQVHRLSDLACGTGAQSFALAREFEVMASDISPAMVIQAQSKIKTQIEGFGHLSLQFQVSDMRSTSVQGSQAAIAMYNAIGHLQLAEVYDLIPRLYHQLDGAKLIVMDCFSLDYYQENPPSGDWELDIELEYHGKPLSRKVRSRIEDRELICDWQTQWAEQSWEEQSQVRLYSQAEILQIPKLPGLESSQFDSRILAQGDMILFYLYQV